MRIKRMESTYKKILENIVDSKSKKDLKNVIWEAFYEIAFPENLPSIKIVILNAPCNGFGDLIFALKLSNFLKEWYNCEVTIVTTLEKGLLGLGADPKLVIGFTGKSKNLQCRRFSTLKMNRELPIQDLIIVAPLQIDFDPDLKDVKKIFPYANILNTFTFSEYNDSTRKKFDFNMGIGQERDGIFITNVIPGQINFSLQNPYVIVYVAQDLANVNKCVGSFVELVSAKYSKQGVKKIDIIVPPWFTDIKKSLIKIVEKYYGKIVLILPDKSEKILAEGDTNSILTFRADVLPVPNPVMLKLMTESLNDILVTGDQSISDALSCCPDKNIFYQIAPWKGDFGKNLEKLLPNPYFKSVKTSCGSIKAVRYKSHYRKFIKNWSFTNLGKPKLDAIVLSIIGMKTDLYIKSIADLILQSRTLKSLQKKVEEILP